MKLRIPLNSGDMQSKDVKVTIRGRGELLLLGVEFLDQLPAVPLFVGDHEEIPPKDVARQTGQPAGDLGDSRAGIRREGDEGFLRLLVLGVGGANRLAVVILLGDEGVLHRLPGVGFDVVAVDIDWMTRRDLAARNQALPQCGLKIQAVLYRDVLEEAVLRGRRREKGETGEQAEVSAADRIDSADASSVSKDGLEDEA